MRKLLTILAFILMTALNYGQQRNPVLEYCTGTWCPWCPCGHTIINTQILPNVPNAVVLGYHGGDEFSSFSGSNVMSLLTFSSYPTGIADRTSGPVGRDSWYSRILSRNNTPATVDISVLKSYDEQSRILNLVITAQAIVELSGDFYVSVVLTEDGLVASQSGNGSCTGGSNYVHNHVVRSMINGATGQQIKNGTWSAGEITSANVNYTVPTNFVADNCHLAVFVYDKGSSFPTSQIQQAEKYELVGGSSINLTVSAGWNMISAPYLASDMSVTSLFPSAISQAFKFDGGYINVSELENGLGYWLKFDQADGFFMEGDAPAGTVELEEGWNLIGPFDANVPVAAITTIPADIIESQFFGFSGAYQTTSLLSFGKGYWVKASESGEMSYNPTLLKGSSTVNVPQIDENWTKIVITDAEGLNQTLYLSDYSVDIHLYEMPPMPPASAFDVRFDNQYMVQSVNESPEINISGAVYPIEISVYGKDLRITDGITSNIFNKDVKNGETITISDPNLKDLVILTESLPVDFKLSQNYPNPFNPTTNITFALPEATNIKLQVFNSLGQEITTLAEGIFNAGSHQVVFDASKISSGVYFYKLSAGDFVSIRKMSIIK